MPLTKAACTTVKQALARVGAGCDIAAARGAEPRFLAKTHPTRRFRPHRWRGYEDYWRFCVARDPVKRLMSCYTDRVVERKDHYRSRNIERGLSDPPPNPDPDFFFQNLKPYWETASTVEHRSIYARLFVGSSLDVYSRVYRTEDPLLLAEDLSVQTGTAVVFHRENTSWQKLTLEDPQTDDDRCFARLSGERIRPPERLLSKPASLRGR